MLYRQANVPVYGLFGMTAQVLLTLAFLASCTRRYISPRHIGVLRLIVKQTENHGREAAFDKN
jgi:hypothetical protein